MESNFLAKTLRTNDGWALAHRCTTFLCHLDLEIYLYMLQGAFF